MFTFVCMSYTTNLEKPQIYPSSLWNNILFKRTLLNVPGWCIMVLWHRNSSCVILSLSVLLFPNILYVACMWHHILIEMRTMIRMTQPLHPPGSQAHTSVLLENHYCCQNIKFPLCFHFHLVSFLPSYDTFSCSSSTEKPHETKRTY